MRYTIKFRRWHEYVAALDIAAEMGIVVCRPKWVINIGQRQKEALDEAGVEYRVL